MIAVSHCCWLVSRVVKGEVNALMKIEENFRLSLLSDRSLVSREITIELKRLLDEVWVIIKFSVIYIGKCQRSN